MTLPCTHGTGHYTFVIRYSRVGHPQLHCKRLSFRKEMWTVSVTIYAVLGVRTQEFDIRIFGVIVRTRTCVPGT